MVCSRHRNSLGLRRGPRVGRGTAAFPGARTEPEKEEPMRKIRPVTVAAIAAVLATSALAQGPDGPEPAGVGRKIADFTLPDPRAGKDVGLADFRQKKAVAVLFLGTE